VDGVLNINKPRQVTSHDVVEKARRIIKEKRIGHTGTLDPIATGVLVLCVGKATRIAQYLEAGEKEYQAIMRLGVTTDTLDADGRILLSRTYAPPDKEKIVEVMKQFIGPIMQQPPVYSALKVSGIPSYKLAREGKAKPLPPRPVFIRHIELTSYEDPFVGFAAVCSKGVYVRSLCADLGEALGMGAHLTGLIRTRSGRFSIQHAVTLEQLANLETSTEREKALMPISEALAEFPVVSLSGKETERVLHGNHISCPADFMNSGGLFRLQDPAGKILALARNVAGVLKPELVFS
jgi:tRNA pseudouridine55 synthase